MRRIVSVTGLIFRCMWYCRMMVSLFQPAILFNRYRYRYRYRVPRPHLSIAVPTPIPIAMV